MSKLLLITILDIFGNDENEENIFEKSDDEPKNQSPVPEKPLAPKNRKRVAVDRSYIDEEGFMGKFYILYIIFLSQHFYNYKLYM